MKELVFLRPGKLEWRERPAPVLRHSEDAIVRPIAATTCDLDVLTLRGRTPFRGPFPIGHECIAEVVEVGEGVRTLRRGQVVAVPWHLSCGTCARCLGAHPNTCAGFPAGACYGVVREVSGDWGGMFADLVRVPHADFGLLPLPDGLKPEHVASAYDNIPFGYELTVPHLLQRPGADVLIMGGVGSVGLYAVAYARAGGAGRVDYVDTDPQRLAIAREFGASIIDSRPQRRMGSYPIVVDASGQEDALVCAIRSVEREGVCASVGVVFKDVPFPIAEMYAKGITFYTGRGRGRPYVAAALDLIAAGKVRPERVVTEIQPFDRADTVLAEPSMKAVLTRPALYAGHA